MLAYSKKIIDDKSCYLKINYFNVQDDVERTLIISPD